MDKINPWNKISLDDYEQHMQHQQVAQSQLLNRLTDKYLQKHTPESVLFLGISGGNGLEHIDTNKVKKICAIDINNSYLEKTQKRFGEKLPQLELVNIDIGLSNESFIKADVIWGALIFEYVDIEKVLGFIKNNAADSAKIIITIQSNNGLESVSPTGVESINAVEDLFKIVNKEDLQRKALMAGFELISSEENLLPNGKSLLTYEFGRSVTGQPL